LSVGDDMALLYLFIVTMYSIDPDGLGRTAWQCPAEWWALRVILGVYSPLSITAMPPGSLAGFSWAMEPSDR
jgi:hypothetical protein